MEEKSVSKGSDSFISMEKFDSSICYSYDKILEPTIESVPGSTPSLWQMVEKAVALKLSLSRL